MFLFYEYNIFFWAFLIISKSHSFILTVQVIIIILAFAHSFQHFLMELIIFVSFRQILVIGAKHPYSFNFDIWVLILTSFHKKSLPSIFPLKYCKIIKLHYSLNKQIEKKEVI